MEPEFDIERLFHLIDQAIRARQMAQAITDKQARGALAAFAVELDAQIERLNQCISALSAARECR
jgi:hypothetical protein